MLVACLRIDHLPVKLEIHRQPHLQEQPVVLTHSNLLHSTVLDASPLAHGVQKGMSLTEAIAECTNAVLVEPDVTHYHHIFNGLLTAIEDLGADVEEHDLGLAYIKLSGLELLFGGLEKLINVLGRVTPEYLEAKIGVASNKFVAYVAASMVPTNPVYYASLNQDELRSSLAIMPVDLLPISRNTRMQLNKFGLRTLGDIAALPFGAVQAQFGNSGRLMWELANGIDNRLFIPRSHDESVEASLSFPSPVTTLDAMMIGVKNLLERAFAQQSIRGRFARVCVLRGSLLKGHQWQKRMVFHEPIGDHHHALGLIRHTLDKWPPQGPLEDLQITLSSITGEAGRQQSLFSEVRAQENLRESIHQLRARLGIHPPIFQVRKVEPWSRVPERRQILVPFVP